MGLDSVKVEVWPFPLDCDVNYCSHCDKLIYIAPYRVVTSGALGNCVFRAIFQISNVYHYLQYKDEPNAESKTGELRFSASTKCLWP